MQKNLLKFFKSLSATLDGDAGGKFTAQREVKKVLVVVAITSNRGLCGAFNTNVIKQAKTIADTYAGKQVDFLPLVKKEAMYLENT
jgi:F-type H+-transporting ATPase subunit gamma